MDVLEPKYYAAIGMVMTLIASNIPILDGECFSTFYQELLAGIFD
ncbi:MAG: hypothetical protein ACLUE2_00580 [Bacteroides cellulosilyticus]